LPNLYVTEQGARIEKEANQLLVCKEGEVLFATPAINVEHVVLVGMIGVTTPAMAFMLERGIDLVLLSSHGDFKGRLTGDHSPHIELRHRQHQRADESNFRLSLAREIVAGKLANQRALCLRWEVGESEPHVIHAMAELKTLQRQALEVNDVESLMGVEGAGATHYFAVFREHLDPAWSFDRRARRPPPDPVNALLSICYTLLHEHCHSALQAVGLDPGCGFLHAPRRGRASLAVDLMEEFRGVIADSVVLTLINKHCLSPADFSRNADGVRLSRDGWKSLAEQFELRMQTLVTPPELKRAISYQKVIEVQARKIRRLIEGSIDSYRPFRTR